MKTRAYTLASFAGLACLLGGASLAQEPSAPEETACLWKIEDEDNTIYLAGSVHLLRQQDYPLPPVFEEAYQDSRKLYFEIDLNDAMALSNVQTMLEMAGYPEGDHIKNHLSEETYAKLQDYLKSRGLSGPVFDRMKPGLMAMNISSLEALRMGALPHLGLDMKYHGRAVADGKPTGALETMEFQLKLFDKLPAEKQEEILAMTLETVEKLPEILGEMISAWKQGDAATLDKLVNEDFEEAPELAKILLFDRNASWIPEIEKAIQGKKNMMFVVGAGHLVGEKSVVDLLRKKGYSVEQMTYAPEAGAN